LKDNAEHRSDSTFESIIAYNAFGAKHNVVLNDVLTEESFLSQISNGHDQLETPKAIHWAILRNAFSISSRVETQYFNLQPGINEALSANVYDDMQPLVASTLNTLSESLPDFVTFNSSIVDQMQWERVADVELSDGTSEAECNLFALVNEFCCNAILPSILGAQFTESYQMLATDLATFNQKYWALALGLPRLFPIQGLPGAALAQKRLLQNLTRMFGELTNPPVRRVPDDDESVSGEETDADVLTPAMKLNELFTKHDIPMAARASITLQLIHDIIAEVVPLVFWTLLHVYATSDKASTAAFEIIPTGKIIAETKPWAQAIQPPSIHPSFPSPPAITFDPTFSQTPADLLPYLHSCVNEARRMYTCSSQTYHLTSNLTLSDPTPSVSSETWTLDPGSYIDIGLSQSLINSSPTIFPDPKTYKAARFHPTPSPPSSFTPIPLPTSIPDPSHTYKNALVLSIVTGIIHLWHISPAPSKSIFDHIAEAREEAKIGAAALTNEQKVAKNEALRQKREKDGREGKWIIPKAVDGCGVKIPAKDVRVRVRRREGLSLGGFNMRRL
jgi:hypothetical protein